MEHLHSTAQQHYNFTVAENSHLDLFTCFIHSALLQFEIKSCKLTPPYPLCVMLCPLDQHMTPCYLCTICSAHICDTVHRSLIAFHMGNKRLILNLQIYTANNFSSKKNNHEGEIKQVFIHFQICRYI